MSYSNSNNWVGVMTLQPNREAAVWGAGVSIKTKAEASREKQASELRGRSRMWCFCSRVPDGLTVRNADRRDCGNATSSDQVKDNNEGDVPRKWRVFERPARNEAKLAFGVAGKR